MKTTTFHHRAFACILVVLFLLISTAGFGLALSLSVQKQTTSKHAACGCITADSDGSEQESPTSEVFHGDFNPSCTAAPTIPAYAPIVECLCAYEPFSTPPQVYFDLFVPPQECC